MEGAEAAKVEEAAMGEEGGGLMEEEVGKRVEPVAVEAEATVWEGKVVDMDWIMAWAAEKAEAKAAAEEKGEAAEQGATG